MSAQPINRRDPNRWNEGLTAAQEKHIKAMANQPGMGSAVGSLLLLLGGGAASATGGGAAPVLPRTTELTLEVVGAACAVLGLIWALCAYYKLRRAEAAEHFFLPGHNNRIDQQGNQINITQAVEGYEKAQKATSCWTGESAHP